MYLMPNYQVFPVQPIRRVSDILLEVLRFNDSPVTFEEHIRKLCADVAACNSGDEAVELIRTVQALIHTRIEALRSNLITVPPIGPTQIEKEAA